MTKLGYALVGLAAVGTVLLLSKSGEAAPSAGTAPGTFPGTPAREPSTAPPKARVRETVNVRSGPTTSAGKIASASAGTLLDVLQTGIASTEPTKSREWWRIKTPSGVEGFASAIGPKGEPNLELVVS